MGKKLAQDYGEGIQSFKPSVTASGTALTTIGAAAEVTVDVSGSLNVFIQPKTASVEVRLSAGAANSMTVSAGEKWGITVGEEINSLFIYSTAGTDVSIWRD